MHPHIVDKELLTICFLLISYKFRLNLFWFTAYSCQREKFTDECFDGEKKALCSVFTPGSQHMLMRTAIYNALDPDDFRPAGSSGD